MWLRVVHVEEGEYLGELMNRPCFSAAVRYGDLISFRQHHVAAIDLTPADPRYINCLRVPERPSSPRS